MELHKEIEAICIELETPSLLPYHMLDVEIERGIEMVWAKENGLQLVDQ